jgi:hypothetical protein
VSIGDDYEALLRDTFVWGDPTADDATVDKWADALSSRATQDGLATTLSHCSIDDHISLPIVEFVGDDIPPADADELRIERRPTIEQALGVRLQEARKRAGLPPLSPSGD